MKTKRVEKHVIKKDHDWFNYCDTITDTSRKLFNTAQYTQRQGYFYGHGYLSGPKLDKLFQKDEIYKALPAKVAQLVLQQYADTWSNHFKAVEAYNKDESKFTGRPKIPGYVEGRNLVKFNNQAIGKRDFNKGRIVPSIQSIAVNGKPLKSVNQFYNKQVAKYRGFIKTGTSRRIQNIVRKRNNFIDSYLHQCTRIIVSEFLKLGVTQVALGKNDQWKTGIKLGKKTNQALPYLEWKTPVWLIAS